MTDSTKLMSEPCEVHDLDFENVCCVCGERFQYSPIRTEVEAILAPHLQEFKAGHSDIVVGKFLAWHDEQKKLYADAIIGEDRLPTYKDGVVVGEHNEFSSNMADNPIFGAGYNTAKGEMRQRNGGKQ